MMLHEVFGTEASVGEGKRVSDLAHVVIGGALAIGGGVVGGIATVAYQSYRTEKAQHKARQDEALLELDELLTPIQIALARSLPQEGKPYFVPPVMDLPQLDTYELGVDEVEGPEKWNDVARCIWEVEKVWRSRLQIRIYDSGIRQTYRALRETGLQLAQKDRISTRPSAESLAQLLGELRSRIHALLQPLE